MIKLKTPIIETHTFADIPESIAGYNLEITDKRETDSTCTVYDSEMVFVDNGIVFSNEAIEANTDEIIDEVPVEIETEIFE